MPSAARDLIVVLPGIMGSTLLRAGRELWSLTPRTIARGLATAGTELQHLALPAGIGDREPDDDVTPGRLMPDLHVIPGIWSVNVGYDRLLTHLRKVTGLRDDETLLPFPYDWRLSNRRNAIRLADAIAPRLHARRRADPTVKVVLIAHSMGGLVARAYLALDDHAADVRTLITLGTPHRGAANAVDRLVNGPAGRIGALLGLPTIARTLPALHQLLPEYACIDHGGELHKLTERPLPTLDPAMVLDAMRFHDELNRQPDTGIPTHIIVGTDQPTATTIHVNGDHVVMTRTIHGTDEQGDATVPRLAARPKAWSGDNPAIHYVTETHGALPANRAVLDHIHGILTANPHTYRANAVRIGIQADDIVPAGQPTTVTVTCDDPTALLEARLLPSDSDQPVDSGVLHTRPDDPRRHRTLTPRTPGGYRIVAGRRLSSGDLTDTVTLPIFAL